MIGVIAPALLRRSIIAVTVAMETQTAEPEPTKKIEHLL
jgi:hypothetical protein